MITCPNCGSDSVTQTTTTDDETGMAEYVCDECGEYFLDEGEEIEDE